MNAILGINFHKQVHVIRQDFQLKQLGSRISTDLLYNFLKPGIHAVDEDGSPILWTPDDVVFTGVHHVAIGFIGDLIG
jgi:hypothetical protein